MSQCDVVVLEGVVMSIVSATAGYLICGQRAAIARWVRRCINKVAK